jgi:hypothetical protein
MIACPRAACLRWQIFRQVCFMPPCAYTAGRPPPARMIRLAGVAAGQARRADLLAALALAASRARSASRSRSPCRESASWAVVVYMMFSFRSSLPRLAAVHTGNERAGAGWTARGKYPRPASGAVRAGRQWRGRQLRARARGDFRDQQGRVVAVRMTETGG